MMIATNFTSVASRVSNRNSATWNWAQLCGIAQNSPELLEIGRSLKGLKLKFNSLALETLVASIRRKLLKTTFIYRRTKRL